jgi:hypothetical protein
LDPRRRVKKRRKGLLSFISYRGLALMEFNTKTSRYSHGTLRIVKVAHT